MKTTIGRPKSFDIDEALEKAMHFFWEHGYESASLSDLLNTMGIKKSSFYQTFESKEALFKRCLALYTQNSLHYFTTLIEKYGHRGFLVELMYVLLLEVECTGKTKGCLVINTGGECYGKFAHLTPLVRENFKNFQTYFMDIIKEAQAQGEIHSDTSPFVLVTVYQSILNGATALVRAGAGKDEIKVLVKEVERLLT